jgi:hypothetical protein
LVCTKQCAERNAREWLKEARAHDIPTGATPVKGAIAVWEYGGGGYGHVAYVSNVLPGGATIEIEEANYVPKTVTYGRHVGSSEPSGYIYGGPAGDGSGSGGGGSTGGGSTGGGTLIEGSLSALISDGVINVFAIGSNGQLYETYQESGGGFSSWIAMAGVFPGGTIEGSLSALISDGVINVFAIGSNGQLYETYQECGGRFSSWIAMAETFP